MIDHRKYNFTEMYDVFGHLLGWAWKSGNSYTSYLFYVEPHGEC